MGNRASYNKNRDPNKQRKHNHFTMGRQGYIPQGVGVTDLRLLKR